MHLEYSCEKNKARKYNDSSEQHPCFRILYPYDDLIDQKSEDQNFYDICDMHSRNIKSNSIFINKICNCLSPSSHLPAWFLMIFSVFLSFSAVACMKFIFQTLCQKHLIYIFHVMFLRCRSSLRRMLSCLTCPDLCRTSVVCITI